MHQTADMRAIPSVDRILTDLAVTDLPRPLVGAIVRRELDSIRAQRGLGADRIIERLREIIEDVRLTRLRPVINGTGIIIHTNFGRSPLAPVVVEQLVDAAANYTNLEFDLLTGERGARGAYLEQNLALLCDSQAATVVNNCAAALVLILRHFVSAARPRVIISRGELVQIGGGFRIPEILEASGATLAEVGTTNKTTLDDYRRAIDGQTAMILKVHRSNFYMDGFVDSPATRALSNLARETQIPFVEDLGSGAFFDTMEFGDSEREPTPPQILSQGADLVCFSGDKLLGGPQAGIIAGNTRHIASLKKEPFFRALRCDKLVLAALEATVDLWLAKRSDEIPIVKMMRAPLAELESRGARILMSLQSPCECHPERTREGSRRKSSAAFGSEVPRDVRPTVGRGMSQVGGGSLPRTQIPSITLDLVPQDGTPLEQIAKSLRTSSPPVVGYIAEGRLKLDVRTIFPQQDEALVSVLRSLH